MRQNRSNNLGPHHDAFSLTLITDLGSDNSKKREKWENASGPQEGRRRPDWLPRQGELACDVEWRGWSRGPRLTELRLWQTEFVVGGRARGLLGAGEVTALIKVKGAKSSQMRQ